MTNAGPPHLVLKRNPETTKMHRRQMFWQVFSPLVVGVILMVVACVLPVVAVARGGDVSKWADTSLIWLILPAIVFSLIPLALFAGIVYGLVRLLGVLPGYMFRIQGVFGQVNRHVRQYSDKAVEPILRMQSAIARIQAAMPKRKNQ